jgi:hypothetical protein
VVALPFTALAVPLQQRRWMESPPAPRPRPRPRVAAAAAAQTSSGSSRSGSNADREMPRRGASRIANPFANFDRVKHWHMMVMCLGCAAAGVMAGQLVEVDEDQLKKNYAAPFDRDVIHKAFLEAFEFRPDLAAATIRAAFHEASERAARAGLVDVPQDPFAPRDEWTGMDACRSARGLEDVWKQVDFQRIIYPDASKSDILALGVIAAVEFLRGPSDKIGFRWGRTDLDAAEEPKTKVEKFFETPLKQDTYKSSGGNENIRFYERLAKIVPNLNLEEAIALLGAHCVGEFHEDVSGISARQYGRVSRHKFYLGVHYYQLLVDLAPEFHPATVPLPAKGDRPRPTVPAMLEASADMKHPTTGKDIKRLALITEMEARGIGMDQEGVEVATSFATDVGMWQHTFAVGMTKLLDAHHTNLRPFVTRKQKEREAKEKAKALEMIRLPAEGKTIETLTPKDK